MAAHGGFGIAVQIRQRTLQDAITILQRAGQLQRRIVRDAAIPIPGQGDTAVHLNLWVDAPRVEFAKANGGMAVLHARLSGSVHVEGQHLRQCRIEMTIETQLVGTIEKVTTGLGDPVFIEIDTFELMASFVPITVTELTVTVLNGPPFPMEWQQVLDSPLARLELGLMLATELTNTATVLPRRLVPVVSALQIGDGVTANVISIVDDGFVTLGIDVAGLVGFTLVRTQGDVSVVRSFLGDGDLALVIDESLAPLLAIGMRSELDKHIDGDLTKLTLSFRDGFLRIAGHAEASAGSADFSLHGKPRLERPGWAEYVDDDDEQYTIWHPERHEVWMDISNVKVDTTVAWWVIALSAAFSVAFIWAGPGVPAALIEMVNALVVGVQVAMVEQGERALIPTTTKGPLAGTHRPPVEITIASIQVLEDRLRTRATFEVDTSDQGGILGPEHIDMAGLDQTVSYTLRDDLMAYDAEDPELRIRWQVRQKKTHQVVKSVERMSTDQGSHRLKVNFANLGAERFDRYTITARVYRSSGGDTEERFNRSVSVGPSDRLDQTHPYVRWTHDVLTPIVEVQPDGRQVEVGKRWTNRHSVIHRTAFPGRCRFADRYSTDLTTVLEYLDELPFPTADLAAHRGEVCDFCFYGGPENHHPLV